MCWASALNVGTPLATHDRSLSSPLGNTYTGDLRWVPALAWEHELGMLPRIAHTTHLPYGAAGFSSFVYLSLVRSSL